MKKKIMAWVLAFLIIFLQMPTLAFAEAKEEDQAQKTYMVPVQLMHAYDPGKASMGNGALIYQAKVVVKDGKVQVDLTFKGLEFMNMYGHLTKLFVYKDNIFPGTETSPMKVIENMQDTGLDGKIHTFPKVLRFEMDQKAFLQAECVWVQVNVDAMDALSSDMEGEASYDKITQGAGAQNAKLVFDLTEMRKDLERGEEPPSPQPGIVDKKALIKAIQDYGNAGGEAYTYESNTRYVKAYQNALTLLGLDASQKVIDEAVKNLKSAYEGLVKAQAPSNGGNSGGNNFNTDTGNQNGNNFSPGNNNQQQANVITYQVPVEVLKAFDSGYSMANNAINHTAYVEVSQNQCRYNVQFGPMQRNFGGKTLTGNLYNLFILDGGERQANQGANNTWSWIMNKKADKVRIKVWVDAMDHIASDTEHGNPLIKGKGAQEAILSLNWNQAKEVSRSGTANNSNLFQAGFQNSQTTTNADPFKQTETQKTVTSQETATKSKMGFSDTNGHWAKTAIDYVTSKGYFMGIGGGKFAPDETTTRGQFVTVLGRMAQVKTKDYSSSSFSDVAISSYYGPYVEWAAKKQIVQGVGDGKYDPNRTISREEMALMIRNFLKATGKNIKEKQAVSFSDQEEISPWAKDAVLEMAKLGLVKGTDKGEFEPRGPFTRAQVAQVLYNIDHH